MRGLISIRPINIILLALEMAREEQNENGKLEQPERSDQTRNPQKVAEQANQFQSKDNDGGLS